MTTNPIQPTRPAVVRYLTIHFAPRTACVTVEIPETKFTELANAMVNHAGDVTLEVSSHHKILTKINR